MRAVPSFVRRLARRARGERRLQRRGGRRRTDHEPRRGWIPALALTLAVAVIDWTTKALIAAYIPLNHFVEVWEGRVAFWHVRNPAMILGLYGDLPLESRKVIAALSGLLAFMVLFEIIGRGHRLLPHRRRWAWIFVGLAFGGMLGNLGERAVHWGVTDYLSLRWGDIWLPPGNVADLALFLSMPLALVVAYFELEARRQRGRSEAQAPGEGRPPSAASPSET